MKTVFMVKKVKTVFYGEKGENIYFYGEKGENSLMVKKVKTVKQVLYVKKVKTLKINLMVKKVKTVKTDLLVIIREGFKKYLKQLSEIFRKGGGGVNPISDFLFMISIHALNHAKMQRKQGILALVFAWSF